MSPWTPSRWRTRPLLLQAAGVWDGQRPWPAFGDWCAAHPGVRCTLAVSAHGLQDLVCDPGLPLADDAAVLQWARPLLQHYHGEAAAGWALAAWQQGAVRGASALAWPLAALQEAARTHRVRLQRVQPWWALVLPRALRQAASLRGPAAELLVLEGARLTALTLARGRVQAIEQRWLDDAGADALDEWCGERPAMARAAVGYGFMGRPRAAMEPLAPLDAPAPAAAWLEAA